MSFFDKKQDVLDVKLTQFGKNLLARGAFKPVYYRFFDDDVLYNADAADIEETQKRSEERIQEAQMLRTQHLVTGVETRFDQNQNLINSGSLPTFMEIKRRQDPLLADKILKYPLSNTKINAQDAPSFNVSVVESEISSSADTISVEGITLPVPQLHISSSFELIEDRRAQEHDIDPGILDYQVYLDLLSNNIGFLDNSELRVDEQDIVINIEELNIDQLRENFDIEIFEIDEGDNLIRLESKEEVEKYFIIEVDEEVSEDASISTRDGRFYRDRN
jgi:hypothetical protein